jgi:hypothetical protein
MHVRSRFVLVMLSFALPLHAQVRVDNTTWQGHEALRLSNGMVEVVVTTGIGPRVIRYAFLGGDNILAELPDTPPTKTPLGEWKPWGGHRLWAAPESMPGSYGPDSRPVQAKIDGATLTLTQPVDAAGLEKQIAVTLAETGTGVSIEHRLTNRSSWPLDLAAWAVTIMRSGGTVIIPNEPFRTHDEALLPVRTITAWAYTDFSDPRWTFGSKFIRLRNDPSRAGSQKIGVGNKRGWVGYLLNDIFFVKRVSWDDAARYPDFGVNTETYTAGDFIELETIGPMRLLLPGDAVTHEEHWSLHKGVNPGATEASLDAALQPLLQASSP